MVWHRIRNAKRLCLVGIRVRVVSDRLNGQETSQRTATASHRAICVRNDIVKCGLEEFERPEITYVENSRKKNIDEKQLKFLNIKKMLTIKCCNAAINTLAVGCGRARFVPDHMESD